MTLQCNLYCKTVYETEDLISMDDPGIWLPCILNMDSIDVVKLSSDLEGDELKGLATLYMKNGDTYITDVPYAVLKDVFIKFKGRDTFVYDSNTPIELNF